MVINAKEYIGKVIDWETLVDLFPGMWVAVTDCKMDGSDIVECKVLAICEDSQMKTVMPQYVRKGVKCTRTTMGLEVGYVHGRIIENTTN